MLNTANSGISVVSAMLVWSMTAAIAVAARNRSVWPTSQLVMNPPYEPPLTNMRSPSTTPRSIRSSQQARMSSQSPPPQSPVQALVNAWP